MTKRVYEYKKRKYDEALTFESRCVSHLLHQWSKEVIEKEDISFIHGDVYHKGRLIIHLTLVHGRFERQRIVNAVLWTIQSVYWEEKKYSFPSVPRECQAPLWSETGLDEWKCE